MIAEARPTLFDDWMRLLCEWIDHQQGCPPCHSYDRADYCPVGADLFAIEQAAHHRWFQARFEREEVRPS